MISGQTFFPLIRSSIPCAFLFFGYGNTTYTISISLGRGWCGGAHCVLKLISLSSAPSGIRIPILVREYGEKSSVGLGLKETAGHYLALSPVFVSVRLSLK